MKPWYRITNSANGEADVYILNDIGTDDISAEDFIASIVAIDAPVINLHVNSNGGEVYDALAMYNAIRAHPSTFIAHVEGIAASAATFPTFACDEIRIAKNAVLMIHDPLIDIFGTADELRKQADLLDKTRDRIAEIYVDRTGAELARVVAWMNEETWFDADEAVAAGFVDSITEATAGPKNNRKRYVNSLGSRVRPTDRVKALGLDELLPAAATPADAGRKVHMDQKKKAAPATKPANAAEAPSPENSPDETPVNATFAVGDSVTVIPGMEHMPEHAGVVFTIAEEKTDFYAVKNPAGEIHKWYASDELEAATPDVMVMADAAKPIATPVNATIAQIKAEFADDRDFALERVDVSAPMVNHRAAYAERLKITNRTLREQLAKAKPVGRKPVDLAAPDSDPDAPKPVTEERKKQLLALAGR